MAEPNSSTSTAPRSLDWRCSPLDLISAWPSDLPMVALCGSAGHLRWGRWSIFATPDAPIRSSTDHPSLEPVTRSATFAASTTGDPFQDLQAALDRTARTPAPTEAALPFVGGWIGWLSYDLGRFIEPAARALPSDGPPAIDDRRWPLMEMFRCGSAILHDAAADRWTAIGELPPELVRLVPCRAGRALPFRVGRPSSTTGARGYRRDVEGVRELIARGDLFQANLAHRLSARFEGSPRAFARAMLTGARPWYGAVIESIDQRGALVHALISASPELFLSVDADRRVVTRPIKGTRPAGADSAELRTSEKDRAELAMITDLMRNDLGRVCAYSSIRVDEERALEHHGAAPGRAAGVQHTVATVSGTLRAGATHTELLRATFPPGSVTGAPKIRAMQVIDALEPVRRGPYCGAIGFISDHGPACWSVAIRTAALSCDPGSSVQHAQGTLDFSVGAGIVHESDPASEWRETLAKAGALRSAVRSSRAVAPRAELSA